MQGSTINPLLLLQDIGEDLSALQSRWLSKAAQPSDPSRASQGSNGPPKTPGGGEGDDNYSQSLQAMNDSLHDLQSDIHRLAAQHSQIQQMMGQPGPQAGPTGANMAPQRPQQHNPLDPQPFYISADSTQQAPNMGGPMVGHMAPQVGPAAPQRRTWGQPQGPMTFAQQGGGVIEWGGGQQPQQQRQRWGQPPSVGPRMGYSPQQQQGYSPQQQPGYSPQQSGYPGPYQDYGGQQQPQWGHDPYGAPVDPYGQPYGGYPSPQQQQPMVPNGSPYGGPHGGPPGTSQGQYMGQQRPSANSFRLHDGSGGPSKAYPGASPQGNINALNSW